MEKTDIVQGVTKVFQNRLKINIEKDKFEAPLLGSAFKLLSSDLIYIFFDLEKEFEIEITEEDIDNECLKTVDAIVEMINNKKG